MKNYWLKEVFSFYISNVDVFYHTTYISYLFFMNFLNNISQCDFAIDNLLLIKFYFFSLNIFTLQTKI